MRSSDILFYVSPSCFISGDELCMIQKNQVPYHCCLHLLKGKPEVELIFKKNTFNQNSTNDLINSCYAAYLFREYLVYEIFFENDIVEYITNRWF